MAKSSPPEPRADYASKKCPECYSYVPLKATVCPTCKTRLGEVGRHGMAERVTNWKAYIICIIAWLVFIIYIKWAFF
jgi:RNA polymerase subunit RPABC4/transcription elongation factor Spt4